MPKNEKTKTNPAGSPSVDEPAFIVIGKLRRPHGLRGEMIMELMTDFPERIHAGKEVYLGDRYKEHKLRSVRPHGKGLLVGFDGVEDSYQAGVLRNLMVFVDAKDIPPLPEGEYYFHELIGSMVVNEEGQEIGILDDILETGANDVYMLRTSDGGELLLPAIEDVILDIDLKKRVIRVRPPEWG